MYNDNSFWFAQIDPGSQKVESIRTVHRGQPAACRIERGNRRRLSVTGRSSTVARSSVAALTDEPRRTDSWWGPCTQYAVHSDSLQSGEYGIRNFMRCDRGRVMYADGRPACSNTVYAPRNSNMLRSFFHALEPSRVKPRSHRSNRTQLD